MAHGVKFITGHCRSDEPLDLDWNSLASPGMTLAVYMGLGNVDEISSRLIAAGRPPDTPVAMIENGTTDDHRQVLTTLAELPAAVAREKIQSPVMFVIGRVALLANELNWFQFIEDQPLEQVN